MIWTVLCIKHLHSRTHEPVTHSPKSSQKMLSGKTITPNFNSLRLMIYSLSSSKAKRGNGINWLIPWRSTEHCESAKSGCNDVQSSRSGSVSMNETPSITWNRRQRCQNHLKPHHKLVCQAWKKNQPHFVNWRKKGTRTSTKAWY